MSYYSELDFVEIKKNINRQGTKILHDIVTVFLDGTLDDPQKAASFCGLLACICEGKVVGVMDEETMQVRWKLTEEYEEKLDALKKTLISGDPNIVKGPWPGA